MIVYLLILLMILADLGCKYFGKHCSNLLVGQSVSGYALYNIFVGGVACLFFFFTGGCKLTVNLPTLRYAALYAFVSAVAVVVGVIAYRFANVSTITIITGTCSLLATASFGAILFQESIRIPTVVRITAMLLAVILSFMDKNKQTASLNATASPKKKTSLLIIPIVLIMLAYQSGAVIIQKYYALDPTVADENSFFFLTNVFIIAVALLVMACDGIKKPAHFKTALSMVNPKKTLVLIFNILCSGACSLLGIFLIARMDLSVYSPIMSAIGILSGVAASLLLRERLGSLSYVAAAIACITVFL